ncbi:Protein SEY1 [Trypanosoma theileri]|uniref:Protein SEY1 homolog n=1 Tax=Trypanosoma theileri TaxID=67003 RepID=A0A1X0P6I5_9TRYP|nr:Protein SEY1 [Trypanosoma theileri]ORC92547.1 Protein SEY1 [Trypanosoma theileri]
MAAYVNSVAAKDIHLIDDNGQLLSEKEMTEFFLTALGGKGGKNTLHQIGVNYHVVGVFGGQSSGKSTLLNRLFHTQFQTMDESRRRGQTTKGAFLARAKFERDDEQTEEEFTTRAAAMATRESSESKETSELSSPLFVLDFEGTDGIERGEDQSFERKLSLFALSVADTLIINMWAVDVGRYNAANMSLLRTIFEVNLQLFAHDRYVKEEKPTLLVVLRDFTEDDTVHYYNTVRQSLDKIWTNIVKPEAFQDASIDALFNLRFHILPHYKLQRPAFDKAIKDFSRWFTVPSSDHYLFHRREMFRGVPLEGIPSYLSNCWEVISNSKDLDIPTQREMLARHRCTEVKRTITSTFEECCRGYTERLQNGELVPQLSKMLDSEVERQVYQFRSETKLYNPTIVKDTLAELEENLLTAELKLLQQYAKTIAVEVLASLDTTISVSVDGTIRWLLQETQMVPFITGNQGVDEDRERELNGTRISKSHKINTFIMDSNKCNKLVFEFWSRLCRVLQADLDVLYNKQGHQRQGQEPKRPGTIYGRFSALVAHDLAMQECIGHVVMDAVYQKVCHRFSSMAENASETIHQAFERILTRRPDGTVRFFNTIKGLQSAEPQARQSGLVLLGCLLYYRLKLEHNEAKNESDENNIHGGKKNIIGSSNISSNCSRAVKHLLSERRSLRVRDNSAEKRFFFHYTTISEPPSYPTDVPMVTPGSAVVSDDTLDGDCILLSQQAVQRVFDLYTQKCEFTMQTQLRNIESGKQNLPAWVLPALLLLGWNELWYVLSSPILLLIVVIVTVVFFRGFIISQWEAFEETAPTWLVLAVQTFFRHLQTVYESVVPPLSGMERNAEAVITADNGDNVDSISGVRHRDPVRSIDVTARSSEPQSKSPATSILRPHGDLSPSSTPGSSLVRRMNKEKNM